MTSVLVSGASGIVGYGILRSLRASGKDLNLIGATIYQDSVAQAFCDVFELAPATSNTDYIPWLLTVIKKHRVDVLIPGIEADMFKWNEFRAVIEQSGAKVVLNRASLVTLCKDKWGFHSELEKLESPYAIESSLSVDYEELVERFGSPFLLKPRQGFGAKGIVTVHDKAGFTSQKSILGDSLLAQQIVGTDEDEFTTSAFCNGRGGFFCMMTMRRKLSKDGFTDKAEVTELDGIHSAVTSLAKQFEPLGPTNFQFRRHNGHLKLLEINPRISSSTSIRSAFGYNESIMAVEFFVNGQRPDQPTIRRGRAVRYVEDHIFYE